jgi:hypothetical protein
LIYILDVGRKESYRVLCYIALDAYDEKSGKTIKCYLHANKPFDGKYQILDGINGAALWDKKHAAKKVVKKYLMIDKDKNLYRYLISFLITSPHHHLSLSLDFIHLMNGRETYFISLTCARKKYFANT